MPDTYTTLWNRVLLRAPAVGPALAQEFVKDSFNQLADRRDWSWLRKTTAFSPPTAYSTGTVSVTEGSSTVTGAGGAAFTSAMVGRQFRISEGYPLYTILSVESGTSLTLDAVWVGASLTAQTYQIFQCLWTAPDDFSAFYSITNLTNYYRLHHNATQAQLDQADPRRSLSTLPAAAAFKDWSANYSGTVGSILQVRGTGPDPVSTTSYGYSYPEDSIYVIEIDTGGAVGACTFKWKMDSGSYTTLVAVPDSNPIDLSNGVQIYFPAGVYVLGDTFIIRCTANAVTSSPRYEFWPWDLTGRNILNITYIASLHEISDDQPQIPRHVRGDVLLEMSLAKAASWPGAGERKNPYYDLLLARQHNAAAERMIQELEVADDSLSMQDLIYTDMPWANVPWLDGAWLQTHSH